MSLQVWLPLDGTLDNYGLTTYTVNQGSTAVSESGKIGKCYDFTGSKYMTLNATSADIFEEDSSFSLCLWVYSRELPSSHTGLLCSNGYQLFGIGIGYRTTGLIYANLMANGYSSEKQMLTEALPLNEWHHVTLTYDNETKEYKGYLDGVLNTTYTLSFDWLPGTTKFLIGHNTQGGHYGYFNGLINDVRIYDHCLSQKELSDISKALIMHYPLNHYGFGNENLALNTIQKYTKSSTSAYGTDTWASGTQYTWLKSIPVESGQDYTLSFDYKLTDAPAKAGCGIGTGAGTNYTADMWSTQAPYETYGGSSTEGHFVYYLAAKTFSDTRYFAFRPLRHSVSTTSETPIGVEIWNFKLEKGDKATRWCPAPTDDLYTTLGLNDTTEYDTSGLKNNGTISSDRPAWTSDSPVYSGSYYFDTTAKRYITTKNIAFENIPQGTVSIWIKRNSSDSTWRNYIFFASAYNWTGKESDAIIIGSTGSTAVIMDCCSNTFAFTPNLGEWYLYTIVWDIDTTTAKYYVNGTLKYTAVDSKINTTYLSKHNTYFIGNKNYTASDYNLSDFRLYATALSDDDVMKLYQSSISIDSSGNLYAKEIVED
jgi:hypothetical protein